MNFKKSDLFKKKMFNWKEPSFIKSLLMAITLISIGIVNPNMFILLVGSLSIGFLIFLLWKVILEFSETKK